MSDQKPILTTDALNIGYLGKKAPLLRDLASCLYRGQVTSLLGPNGVGKSTLLRTLAGIQEPLSGRIMFNGDDIAQMSPSLRSRKIAVVLTEHISAGGLKVFELASLGRQPYTGFFGRLSAHDRQIVDTALENVGMAHKSGSYVAELSDGERQRVMIAKAIAQQTPLILLDEPTAFLDAVARIEIMQLLRRLSTDFGKTILLSTHDIDTALQLSDNLWLIKNNSIVSGTTQELVSTNQFADLFDSDTVKFDVGQRRYLIDS